MLLLLFSRCRSRSFGIGLLAPLFFWSRFLLGGCRSLGLHHIFLVAAFLFIVLLLFIIFVGLWSLRHLLLRRFVFHLWSIISHLNEVARSSTSSTAIQFNVRLYQIRFKIRVGVVPQSIFNIQAINDAQTGVMNLDNLAVSSGFVDANV